jgi:hypothetical protein
MRYLPALLIAVSMVLFSCSNNPASSTAAPSAALSNSGAIKGRVIIDSTMNNPYIFLIGVDGVVMADSTGNFKFQFVEPGTYSISISANYSNDTLLKNVTVEAGKVTDLGTITLSRYVQNSSYSYNNLSAYFSIDHNYSTYFPYYYSGDTVTIISVFGDSIWFEITAYNPSLATYEVRYAVKIDSVTIKTGYTQKLSARFTLPLPSGSHLYELYQDTTLERKCYLNNYKSPGPIAMFTVTNLAYYEYPDFDIMLVNPNHDTCWYRNSHPDWGIHGSGYDDPVFSGDVKGFSSNSFERIILPNPASGSYSLYIRNFYDSTLASNYYSSNAPGIPSVAINLNSVIDTVSFPVDSLRPGKTWFVGRFTAPGMTFQTVDSLVN